MRLLKSFWIMLLLLPISAQAIETKASYALLLDVETGVALFEKNADARMSPASMSKLMTVLMAFEALESGAISAEEKFFVSDDAWRRGGAGSGGSTMFLKARSRVSVLDLLRGVIIQSGNDACIALAEGMAGSEPAFAEIMTERAQELGMSRSRFINSTGLPDPDHKTTARDMAILARQLINSHADYYRLFSERDFTWNNIRQTNRNPLLYANIGADGLKTGHTQESGYGLVASAEQNGRRLILVINGLNSKRERAREARKLMTFGFRNFQRDLLVEAGQQVAELPVWHGDEATVKVTTKQRFDIVTPRSGRRKMVATVTYENPVLAPIKIGDRLGKLRVTLPGLVPQEVDLVAAEDINKGNIFGRSIDSLLYIIVGD
ncbi:MAG TPA: D-alanyl-D-alanine carboxypeptidase [Rhodobiaceae bacterium]|nr:D-alanyl-D-alanine carboxypeptidase [Rhodobiaceae bacterium]|tara:strand:+ start:7010 stop:8143 length:1134 start_codon:yes stop_codon:yes gene_type:complete